MSKNDLMCSVDQKIRPGMEHWLLVQLLWRWSALENWTKKSHQWAEALGKILVFSSIFCKKFSIFVLLKLTTNHIANHRKGTLKVNKNKQWFVRIQNITGTAKPKRKVPSCLILGKDIYVLCCFRALIRLNYWRGVIIQMNEYRWVENELNNFLYRYQCLAGEKK